VASIRDPTPRTLILLASLRLPFRWNARLAEHIL